MHDEIADLQARLFPLKRLACMPVACGRRNSHEPKADIDAGHLVDSFESLAGNRVRTVLRTIDTPCASRPLQTPGRVAQLLDATRSKPKTATTSRVACDSSIRKSTIQIDFLRVICDMTACKE